MSERTLSVCTIMQDEEESIVWYLECCRRLHVDLGDRLREIILVDGGSIDRTLDVVWERTGDLPVTVLERPFDCVRDQWNFGLEHCTGEWVFGPDADFTWTTNLAAVFDAGVYDASDYWQMRIWYVGDDKTYYPENCGGYNLRLWRAGVRWAEHRQYHCLMTGQPEHAPVCPHVICFENSLRIKSERALLHRGRRRQHYADALAAEGMGPGPVDRFVVAKSSRERVPIPDDVQPFLGEWAQ